MVSRTDDVALGSLRHAHSSDTRQLLALGGGGFRGYFTAAVLERLERTADRPLREVFDVVAGTSVGGLIAAAIALGVPATEIRSALEQHGPRIFEAGRRRLTPRALVRLFRSGYRSEPLANAIDAMLGEDAARPLSRIDTPLVLSAVDAGSGHAVLLRSRGLAGVTESSPLALADALLATAAAPSYFPPHHTALGTLVDGGLVANAPDLVVLTETMRCLGTPLERLRVLSVGTASPVREPRRHRSGSRPGIASWLLARGLFQLTLSAQESLAIAQCAILLGERHLRLDRVPMGTDADRIGLDRAGPEAIERLARLAEERLDALGPDEQERLVRWLAHRALGGRERLIPRLTDRDSR